MSSAVVFGGTGLVGNYLIKTLINDEYYTKIKAFTRSEINITNSKGNSKLSKVNFNPIIDIIKIIPIEPIFKLILLDQRLKKLPKNNPITDKAKTLNKKPISKQIKVRGIEKEKNRVKVKFFETKLFSPKLIK